MGQSDILPGEDDQTEGGVYTLGTITHDSVLRLDVGSLEWSAFTAEVLVGEYQNPCPLSLSSVWSIRKPKF